MSSTAVTISMANRAKLEPEVAPAAAGAIGIASTIMVVRVGVLVAITNMSLLPKLLVPLAGAALGAALGILLVFRRPAEGSNPAKLENVKNPFDLGSAVRFGAVFAVILLATKAAQTYLGNQGLYLAALIAGLTDVDAVTLSTARNAGAELHAAMVAILLAVASNTIVKSSLAWGIGGRALGQRAFLVGALIIAGAAGGAGAALALS